MTHEELRDRLLDLAYGELAPRAAREVEEHAAACEACRAELARIAETRRLMAALPVEPAPPHGERILHAAAREAARRREPRRMLPPWLWGGSLVAVSLAAVVAVSYRIVSMRPGGVGREDPNALMGSPPYSAAPPAAEQPAAPPPMAPPPTAAPPAAEPAPAPRAELAKPDRRRDEGPRSGAHDLSRAPQRFASPPPPEEEPLSSPDAARPGVAEKRARTQREESRDQGAAGPSSAGAAANEAAPAPAPPAAVAAPSRAAAKAAPSAVRAPPALASGAGADAVARYEALRRAGRLRAEIETFPGCDGELWRRIERDPDGRTVSYAREELLAGRRVRVEVIYGTDGALAQVRVLDAASSAPIVDLKPWVPAAGEVDGPPRCTP